MFHNGNFYITDSCLKGTFLHLGEYSSVNPWVRDGFSRFYDELGNLYAKGNFRNDEMVGEWVYYFGFSQDTVSYVLAEIFINIEDCQYLKKESNRIRKGSRLHRTVVKDVGDFFNNNMYIPPRSRVMTKHYYSVKTRIRFLLDIDGRIKCPEFLNVLDNDLKKEFLRLLSQYQQPVSLKRPIIIEMDFTFYDEDPEEFADVYLGAFENPFFEKPGLRHFYKYIHNNINHPANGNIKKIEPSVWVTFIVETDGSISNVKVTTPFETSFDMEAVRVVSSSPSWSPGLRQGVPVRVRMNLEVSFGRRKK